MSSIDKITALTKQIENAGLLIKRVELLALHEHDLAAWDCLIALARAAQEMVDEQIYADYGSFRDAHEYSIQQNQL
jgi:hypothetical protein